MTANMERVVSTYSPLIGKDMFRNEPTDEVLFWNYGYWHDGTNDPKQASAQLADYLIGKLPSTSQKILDVGFGQGGSTRRLCERFGADKITGINIAPDQVAFAKKSGVPCQLMVMDAAHISFDANTFDGILCMEAAFHFRSRAAFLRHAHRVLKPGGRLVMSDILYRADHGLDPEVYPIENRVSSLPQYQDLFTEAGFKVGGLSIEQSTDKQLVPLMTYMAKQCGLLPFPVPDQIKINTIYGQQRVWFIMTTLLNVADCVTVVAEKS